MAGRSSLWTTSQIFFVYDHTILQKEEDDLKDAIVYFSPPNVDDDDQCALCGQLMGMVSFFQATWGAKPRFYQLIGQKFVLIHVEDRYTLALGAKNSISDHCLEQQLQLLYDTFTMYMGSLAAIRQESECKGTSFSEALQPIWECFLPFCCAYGDDVRRGFFSLPTVDLPKSGADIFLQASSMLQASKRRPGVLGGAVLSSNGILCTQLSEELTSRFLVIKPQQNHLPCQQVQTDFDLPAGVRIISVLISEAEYSKLVQHQRPIIRHTCMSRFRPTAKSYDPPTYTFANETSSVKSHSRTKQTVQKRNSNDFLSQMDQGMHLSSVSSLDCQNAVSVNTEKSKQDHQGLAETYFGLHRNTDPDSFPKCDTVGQNSSGDASSSWAYSYNIEEENSDNEGSMQTSGTISHLIYADVHADSSLSDQNLSVRNDDLTTVQSEAVGSHLVSVQPKTDAKLETSQEVSGLGDIDKKIETSQTIYATDKFDKRIESSVETSSLRKNDKHLETSDKMSSFPEHDKILESPQEVCDLDASYKKSETSQEISGTDTKDKQTEMSPEISCSAENEKKTQTFQEITDVVKRIEQHKVQDESTVRTDTPEDEDKEVQHEESQYGGVPVFKASMDENRSSSLAGYSDSLITKEVTESISEDKAADRSSAGLSRDTNSRDNIEAVDFSSKIQEELAEENVVSFHANSSADSAICVSSDQFQDERTEDVPSREITVLNIECEGKSEGGVSGLSGNDNHGDKNHPNTSSSDTSIQLDEGKETFVFSSNSSQKLTSDSTDRLSNQMPASDSKKNRVLSFDLALDSQELPENGKKTKADKDSFTAMSQGRKDIHSEPKADRNGAKDLILYIQGYSDSMMILLLEEEARRDKETIMALWKFALPQLGDLDFRVKELVEMESRQPAPEDYHFLMFNDFQRQVSGNVTKPVTCGEFEFCDLAIDLHEEFHKSASVSELSARTHRASIYARRSVNHEVYFQSTSKFRQPAGLPNPKDMLFSLDQVAQRKLYKNHNITLV